MSLKQKYNNWKEKKNRAEEITSLKRRGLLWTLIIFIGGITIKWIGDPDIFTIQTFAYILWTGGISVFLIRCRELDMQALDKKDKEYKLIYEKKVEELMKDSVKPE